MPENIRAAREGLLQAARAYLCLAGHEGTFSVSIRVGDEAYLVRGSVEKEPAQAAPSAGRDVVVTGIQILPDVQPAARPVPMLSPLMHRCLKSLCRQQDAGSRYTSCHDLAAALREGESDVRSACRMLRDLDLINAVNRAGHQITPAGRAVLAEASPALAAG